ncbi:MAG: molybdate ABC transporter substrate-binding protein [Andreesenia angusta]|nr:molybdate ABC transporter substrate-binding protein [Andreesenia angusta]
MKRIIAIALLCLSTISVIGCEDANVNNDVEKKTETEQALKKETDDNGSEKESIELTVFSGAGLKKPMEEIKSEFENENPNIKINYIFAGAGQLLSQLELGNKGDVFITGSIKSYESAKEKNLVGPSVEIAHHTPVIAVQKGNPKDIKSLEDLKQPGLKIMVGDEKANAIGMTTQKIIEKNNLPEINDNVISKAATVNEIVAQFGASDSVDAAIVTKDSVFNNENIEIIEIPEDKNIDQIIPISILEDTEHRDEANKFVDYVSSEIGLNAFEKYGFKPVSK